MLVDRAATFTASAKRLLGREVDDLAGFFALFVITKIKLQLVVFSVFIKLDNHLCRERPARFGAETIQRADFSVAQKLLDLGHFKGAPCGRFAEGEATTVFGA